MDAAVRLEGVVKQFGDHRAVDGLAFEVPRGSIFGLLGRNGAGKSTTIRMILDIIRPDRGTIAVLGRPIDQELKDRLGYLPEERGLYPKMKVIDLLEFLGSIKGIARAEARSRSERWLERLELADWTKKKVQDLSKGMQQKVQFIGAILHEPDLLILDEPFSGMDPVNQELFTELIGELGANGATVIFSTHVMASAEQLCKRIVLIDHGKAVLSGDLDEIKEGFGNNTVRLRAEGDLDFVDGLPGVISREPEKRGVLIRLAEGSDPQALLERAVARTRVQHFEVVRPTLQEIFIRKVGAAPDEPTARPEVAHA